MMAATEEEWSCSACTFANHPDLISCEICGTDRSDHLLAATSIASQEQILKTAGRSVSSAPSSPQDSLLYRQDADNLSQRQPQADKKTDSNSTISSDPSVSAALPKMPPQQQAEKKTLSVSSSSFDPLRREKMWGPTVPPTLTTTPTSTTTTTSTAQHNSISQHGNAVPAAMMPGSVYHHPMNMILPPMTMPGHGMPMMAVHGQVNNRYHSPTLTSSSS